MRFLAGGSLWDALDKARLSYRKDIATTYRQANE